MHRFEINADTFLLRLKCAEGENNAMYSRHNQNKFSLLKFQGFKNFLRGKKHFLQSKMKRVKNRNFNIF